MQNNRAGRLNLAGAALKSVDEVQVGGLIAAAVQPDIQRHWLCEIDIVRDHQAVRLNRIIDARPITSHDQACLPMPGRLAGGQLFDPLCGRVERLIGSWNLFLVIELTVSQSVVHGLQKHFGIIGAVVISQFGKLLLQLIKAYLQPLVDFRRQLDARRRKASLDLRRSGWKRRVQATP
jgi:hypothetical protein